MPPDLARDERFLERLKGSIFRVDADGTVWRLMARGRTGKLRAITPRRADFPRQDGYRAVRAGNDTIMAHRLVWLAFHGPIPFTIEVNHVDGCGGRNALSNLELTTPSENAMHAYRLAGSSRVQGERNGRAKLTRGLVTDIRCRAAAGEAKRKLSREFGVAPVIIRRIVSGRYWKPEIERNQPALPPA